jgi:uncharacterized protein (TIGR04255 family)
MARALGQLPNAPLIYVLAQIIFTRVPKMTDIWENFHQLVFEVYPDAEVERIDQFSIKKEGVESSPDIRWNFLSRDRCKGLILRSDALILHTTSYTTSNDFFRDLQFALANLSEVIPSGIQTKRLGLRYVDMLLPQNNLDVADQLVEKLGMVNLGAIGCSPVRFDHIERYKTPIGGELIFRHRQTTGMDVLPSDLFPNKLEPAPLLQIEKQPEWTVGLLDFDHYVMEEIPLESQTIVEKFQGLKKVTSEAFRTVTTPDAMRAWKES